MNRIAMWFVLCSPLFVLSPLLNIFLCLLSWPWLLTTTWQQPQIPMSISSTNPKLTPKRHQLVCSAPLPSLSGSLRLALSGVSRFRGTTVAKKSASGADLYLGKAATQTVVQQQEKFSVGPCKPSANVRVLCRFDYQPDVCKDYKETGLLLIHYVALELTGLD